MSGTSKEHWLGAVVRLLLNTWPREVCKGPEKQWFSSSCSVPHELFLAVFLLAHMSIMLAFTAYFTFIGSWITRLYLIFYFEPSSIIVLYWDMDVTLLGFFFCYLCLRYTFKFIVTIMLWVILKELFSFYVYKLYSLLEKMQT